MLQALRERVLNQFLYSEIQGGHSLAPGRRPESFREPLSLLPAKTECVQRRDSGLALRVKPEPYLLHEAYRRVSLRQSLRKPARLPPEWLDSHLVFRCEFRSRYL